MTRMLNLGWGSDVDGDLHMFARSDEPDRFDWMVTVVTPPVDDDSGDWMTTPKHVFAGDGFVGVTARMSPDVACWFIYSRDGFVEITIPGSTETYVAKIGSPVASPGVIPR